MRHFLANNPATRKRTAVLVTLLLSAALTLWGIYGIGSYGIALFILTPLLLGFLPAVLYGYGWRISRRESVVLGFTTLGWFTGGLILFALEGLICIAMAAPFGVLFTWIGALLAHLVVRRGPNGTLLSAGLLLLAIPLLSTAESDAPPVPYSVETVVDIAAPPERVWETVVAFPRLPAPEDWLFRIGIAYPVGATIDGAGVGAVRHCTFNTGSFVEPITQWEPPYVLAFDVAEQPVPLREISFWDVDAPHLHDYFVSRRGQFELTRLPDGGTRLRGTTWYTLALRPAWYWRWWSDVIIHRIHGRVLAHVGAVAEAS